MAGISAKVPPVQNFINWTCQGVCIVFAYGVAYPFVSGLAGKLLGALK